MGASQMFWSEALERNDCYRVIVVGATEDTGVDAPGNTTTRVPTFTRVYRSEISSLVRRTQPDDTKVPIVDGWLVPWIRYSVLPR